MKILAALLAGGALFAADMPNVSMDECAVVSLDIETGEPTFIDPEPAAESMRLIVYCGQRVVSSTGYVTNERALKYIDVDLEQAEVIVQAADDMVSDGDVFIGGNP